MWESHPLDPSRGIAFTARAGSLPAYRRMKRVEGFAPSASALARQRSTAELHPRVGHGQDRTDDLRLVMPLLYC